MNEYKAVISTFHLAFRVFSRNFINILNMYERYQYIKNNKMNITNLNIET